MKYSVITFGCRVNQADSLGFEEELLARGGRSRPPRRGRRRRRQYLLGDRDRGSGARQTIRRIARENPHARIVVTGCYATRRPEDVRDSAERRPRRAQRRQAPAGFLLRGSPGLQRLASCGRGLSMQRPVDRRAVWRRRRQLRRGDRARRRGPDRVHAARADRLRRAVLLLHHSDDPRRAAKRALDRVCGVRSNASLSAGFKEIALTGVHLGSYGRDLTPVRR